MAAELSGLLDRLEAVTSRLEKVSTGGQASDTPNINTAKVMGVPPVVEELNAILNGPLADFLHCCDQIGGDCKELGALTKSALESERDLVWMANGRMKANDAEFGTMLTPTSKLIQDIQHLKNAKRRSEHFNHLSAVAEGIPALGWVTVAPAPVPFVKEMSDASQFYTNRVLKEFKEKDKVHADWVKAWLATLNQLQQYVKQHHTTGLVWNSAPGSAPMGKTAAAPMGGVPPPPPGPPPPPPLPADLLAKGGGDDEDSRAALFADINKGLDITASLKKVTADMQTHKNPNLRTTEPKQEGKPRPTPKPAHLKNGAKSDPKAIVQLEGGKKWVVENHKHNKNILIEATDMKQVVYIWKCQDSVIQIKGKINSITMDSCKKTSVVFDHLVSSVEIINCQSAQVQTLGAMPTLQIQKTDGCQVYLSRESLNTEIVSSKSSEMNILLPDETGEFKEFVMPEQYKTVWTGKDLRTIPVDVA